VRRGSPLTTNTSGLTDVHDRCFDAVLADGSAVHVRDIRPEDAKALVAFHTRLSESTVVLRFFCVHPRLSEREVEYFTKVDGRDRFALVAESAGDIIAVGRYDRIPATDDAEVAFVVGDAYQGKGIGSILLQHLVLIARGNGIVRFVAETLTENHRMFELLRGSGCALQSQRSSGTVRVVLDISANRKGQRGRMRLPSGAIWKPSCDPVIASARSRGRRGGAIRPLRCVLSERDAARRL
jgi:GNAT superfamily N-acetyltransferase